jgi:hypothetical protein
MVGDIYLVLGALIICLEGGYEGIIGYMNFFLRVNVGYGSVGLATVLLVLRGVGVLRVESKYTGDSCVMTLLIGTHRRSKTNTDYAKNTLLMHCTLEITDQFRDVLQYCFPFRNAVDYFGV